MVCRNCGKETGGRYDCPACGYDPTKDDPNIKNNVKANSAEATLPPIEVVLRKKANIPAIIGFVCSILMCIPIPLIGWLTTPTFFLSSVILTIIGFVKAKACRSGRGFAIAATIICIVGILLIAIGIVIVLAFGGASLLAQIAAMILPVLSETQP